MTDQERGQMYTLDPENVVLLNDFVKYQQLNASTSILLIYKSMSVNTPI